MFRKGRRHDATWGGDPVSLFPSAEQPIEAASTMIYPIGRWKGRVRVDDDGRLPRDLGEHEFSAQPRIGTEIEVDGEQDVYEVTYADSAGIKVRTRRMRGTRTDGVRFL